MSIRVDFPFLTPYAKKAITRNGVMAFLFCANGPACKLWKHKNPVPTKSEQDRCGGDDRDRTDYLLNAIQALSQVSYTPTGYTRIKCSFILSDFSRIVKSFFTITSGIARPYCFKTRGTLQKQKRHDQRRAFYCGGDDRDRTDYLLNAIQALSQVSYTPEVL